MSSAGTDLGRLYGSNGWQSLSDSTRRPRGFVKIVFNLFLITELSIIICAPWLFGNSGSGFRLLPSDILHLSL